MLVAVTGACGLIGAALVRNLRADGHEVRRLVRRAPAGPDEVRWDPSRRQLDPADLAGVDAVVHLAGAGIGDHRWTDAYKQQIRSSRVDGTATVAAAVAALDHKPRVLLSGSAVGFYGDTGDNEVDETSPRGSGFLAEVVEAWEAATAPAAAAGVRVMHVRSGVVLSADGGALGKVLPLFRVGLGGRLGSGRQWMSWIALPDHVAAMRWLLSNDDISGPVNLTAPEPVRNRDYTKAVARAVHRPAFATAPAPALRAALGGVADEGVLVSQRAVPGRLERSGFAVTYADIDAAVTAVVG
jgi:uncharacterized protein (TIGR01777 family)